MLLKQGANPCILNNCNRDGIDLACEYASGEAIRLILQHMSDITAKSLFDKISKRGISDIYLECYAERVKQECVQKIADSNIINVLNTRMNIS